MQILPLLFKDVNKNPAGVSEGTVFFWRNSAKGIDTILKIL